MGRVRRHSRRRGSRQRPRRAEPGPASHGDRAGSHVRGDVAGGQRRGRAAGAGRHRSRHVHAGPGSDRGGYHGADTGRDSGPPVRTNGLDGRDRRHCPAPRPAHSRGRGPGARCPIPRPARRLAGRCRGLELLPVQESGRARRRRRRHERRRRAAQAGPAAKQLRVARAVPPRGGRRQLTPGRDPGRHLAGQAGAPR